MFMHYYALNVFLLEKLYSLIYNLYNKTFLFLSHPNVYIVQLLLVFKPLHFFYVLIQYSDKLVWFVLLLNIRNLNDMCQKKLKKSNIYPI